MHGQTTVEDNIEVNFHLLTVTHHLETSGQAHLDPHLLLRLLLHGDRLINRFIFFPNIILSVCTFKNDLNFVISSTGSADMGNKCERCWRARFTNKTRRWTSSSFRTLPPRNETICDGSISPTT